MAGLYAAHVAEAGDEDKAAATLRQVIDGALWYRRQQSQGRKPLSGLKKLLLQGERLLQQGENPLPWCKKSLLNGKKSSSPPAKTSLSSAKKSLSSAKKSLSPGKKSPSPAKKSGKKPRTSSTASTVLSGLIHRYGWLQEAHSGRLPVPPNYSADVVYSHRSVAVAGPAAPMRRGRRG